MNMKRHQWMVTVAIALAVAWCGTSQAQYADWRGWKPVGTTDVFKAPAPFNAAARSAAFAARNSPSNLVALAQMFFGMMDLNRIADPKVRELVGKQRWEEALTAYRDFFVERLRFPPPSWSLGPVGNWGFPLRPLDPAERVIYNYIHSADELMANTMRLAVQDPQGSNVTVRLNVGPPGQVNWTWLPTGYSWNRIYFPSNSAPITYVYGQANCFNALLTEYLKTGDKRYLEKWADFLDDRSMNWRQDSARAGYVPICWNDVESYTRGFFPNMEFLARKAPNFGKDLPPATLARELLRMWTDYVPRNIRAPRCSTSNRRIGIYSQHLLYLALLCPEFHAASYCLQQFRWMVETFPTVEMMPDGSDMEPWFCYNHGTPRLWFPGDWGALRQMSFMSGEVKPDWVTPEWQAELFEMCERRGSYLMHRLMNSGGFPYTGACGGREDTYMFNAEVPEATGRIDPENLRIRNTLFRGGLGEPPSFHSEAFPYGGYYYLRNGWSTNDLCLVMHSTRPGMNASFAYNNGITLYAYGQTLLWVSHHTPITVDGCYQVGQGGYALYPPEARTNRIEPKYGKEESGMASHTPLKNRWLDSKQFALCEGTYSGPYLAGKPDPNRPGKNMPDKFIDDVAHQRQIVLLKKAGLYVVTDRLRAPKPHQYSLNWALVAPAKSGAKIVQPGFDADQIVRDDKAKTLITKNPEAVNLSVYHVSAAPLQMCGYGGQFSATGDQQVVSLLYPRRTIQDELSAFTALTNAGSDVIGFEARLADGARLLYHSAPQCAQIRSENVAIDGEALLLMLPPSGTCHGIALGCKEFKFEGKLIKIPVADFEFTLPDGKTESSGKKKPSVTFKPIYRPMDMVEFEPQADRFTNEVTVSMRCADTNTEIRYTLDWSDPDGSAHLYTNPVTLRMTTMVKARAFRKGVTRVPPTVSGTEATAVRSVVYTSEKAREPAKTTTVAQHGLYYSYFEEDQWQLSSYLLSVLKPVKTGVAKELFDISAKGTNGVYAFIYYGMIDIPVDGIYSFHAPPEFVNPGMDSGYELRVAIGRDEWYPATRWHNFGVWSVPLKKGMHYFNVAWVDQRKQDVHFAENEGRVWDGEKPTLMISGPGLEKQPIPASMLYPY